MAFNGILEKKKIKIADFLLEAVKNEETLQAIFVQFIIIWIP